ncbi:PAS domain S-box [Synechococcus sp. PCC 7502]|uniref:PAS domain S-box protein n=1 Tax=Synechococcus sp. PCC 7502 TaxID=1173263 RepID=UPI00029FA4F0|nr:PAS domain S-box protein [Synechococcus sp. PCC 7502]AFY75321.1 PAS domain S-box [Synechococcus sp. PCC 7502]
MLEALEELLEHIDYGIFVIAVSPHPHSQLHFLSINSSCAEVFNFSGHVTGLEPAKVLPLDCAQRLVDNCNRAIESKHKVDYEEIFKFPHSCNATNVIAIHLSPVLDAGGNVQKIIGSVNDLSHSRLGKINRDIFSCLVTGDTDAVIVVDREGVVRFVNPAAEVLFDRSAQELEGEQFGLPIVSGEQTEVDILRPNGQSTPAELRISHTQGEDEIVYIIASLRDISVRKLGEESLRLRDRALAASVNGIIIVDAKQPDNPIIYINPSFERITGYKASEVIGSNCRFLQGGDRSQEGLSTIREAVKQGKSCYTVLRNYRKDGTLFWVELWVSPVHNEMGELTNFIGIQNDITSRVLNEIERQESEEVLRTVLSAVKEGITFSDERGKFLIFNQEMENLTGYSMAEANSCPNFISLIHPEEQGAAIAQIQKLRQFHSPVESEVKIQTKAGVIRNVLVCSSMVSYKGKTMYLSAYRDITERKEAEEKLRQTAERDRLISAIALRIRNSIDLTNILQNTVAEVREFLQTDRVLIYQFQDEGEGKIVVESVLNQCLGTLGREINDDCFSKDYLLAYPQGRVTIIDDTDDPELDLCHAEFLKRFEVRANLVVPITCTDRVWGLLIAHQCTDTRVWKEEEITLLTGLAEQVAIGIRQAELLQKVQTLNTDLEQQVEERTAKLSLALSREKELGEMKSRFVSMASHEFRTPLAIIQASSDLLKHYNHKLTEDKRIEKLDKIQLEVRNMTELLEDVLVIGKIEMGKMHLNRVSLDLEKFCLESIAEFKSSLTSSDRITFRVENRQGTEPSELLADPKLLRQIMINLLSNGIKYSLNSPKEVTVNLYYDTESFDLEFIDQGIGIPPDEQDKIFESFHRAENVGNIPGTGLGLAITKVSVELHKGKIRVDSQVNIGTKITITIPYQ